MRTTVLAVLILGMASLGWAGPASVKSAVPVRVTMPDQQLCWYQAPHYYLWTLNASTGFGSELADDFPRDVTCLCPGGIIFYVGEWAGAWQDPAGFCVDAYSGQCPPEAVEPRGGPKQWVHQTGPSWSVRYFYPWGGPGFSERVIYSDPGWFECHEVTQFSDRGQVGWTVGLLLVTPWGRNPPYTGIVATDYYVYHGCGQAYWCFEAYGIHRWVTVGGYFGVPADMAYGIFGEPAEDCWGPARAPGGPGGRRAAESTTWGAMKSLYE